MGSALWVLPWANGYRRHAMAPWNCRACGDGRWKPLRVVSRISRGLCLLRAAAGVTLDWGKQLCCVQGGQLCGCMTNVVTSYSRALHLLRDLQQSASCIYLMTPGGVRRAAGGVPGVMNSCALHERAPAGLGA